MAPTLEIAVTTTWAVVIITEVTAVTMPITVADGGIIIMAATAGMIIMMGCVVTIGVIERCHSVAVEDIMVRIAPMGGVIMALNVTAVDRG